MLRPVSRWILRWMVISEPPEGGTSRPRSTTAPAVESARDRFVYGRLTPAADPYGSRTCHASDEGWKRGTRGVHPLPRTASREGGVITVALPVRGLARRSS